MVISNILIPVDMSVASLKTLKLALEREEAELVNVVLIYPFRLSDSITDLLFYSESRLLEKLMSQEFKEGLEMLKNRFSNRLNSLSIRLLPFISNSYLRSFIESQDIDKMYLPRTYQLKMEFSKKDLMSVMKSTLTDIVELDWEVDSVSGDSDQLTQLFK